MCLGRWRHSNRYSAVLEQVNACWGSSGTCPWVFFSVSSLCLKLLRWVFLDDSFENGEQRLPRPVQSLYTTSAPGLTWSQLPQFGPKQCSFCLTQHYQSLWGILCSQVYVNCSSWVIAPLHHLHNREHRLPLCDACMCCYYFFFIIGSFIFSWALTSGY